jgi:hypothetical protein
MGVITWTSATTSIIPSIAVKQEAMTNVVPAETWLIFLEAKLWKRFAVKATFYALSRNKLTDEVH